MTFANGQAAPTAWQAPAAAGQAGATGQATAAQGGQQNQGAGAPPTLPVTGGVIH